MFDIYNEIEDDKMNKSFLSNLDLENNSIAISPNSNLTEIQSNIFISGNNLEPLFMEQVTLYSSGINRIEPIISEHHINISNSQKNNQHLGRKRKDCEEKGLHTKYSEDNMILKAKVIFKEKILEHINEEMGKIKDFNVKINGKIYKVDAILDINPKKIATTKIIPNRELLSNPVKYLFSEDISGKYRKFPKNYNQIVIDQLYEKNYERITSILDISFLNCIKFFRKDDGMYDDFPCLKGLEKKFENLPNKLREEKNKEDYINMLIQLIKNFEQIFNDKKPRERGNH